MFIIKCCVARVFSSSSSFLLKNVILEIERYFFCIKFYKNSIFFPPYFNYKYTHTHITSYKQNSFVCVCLFILCVFEIYISNNQKRKGKERLGLQLYPSSFFFCEKILNNLIFLFLGSFFFFFFV